MFDFIFSTLRNFSNIRFGRFKLTLISFYVSKSSNKIYNLWVACCAIFLYNITTKSIKGSFIPQFKFLLGETLQMHVSMQTTKQPLVNRYQYSLISNIVQKYRKT